MAKHYPPADEGELGRYELSTHLLALEVMRRGGQVDWINRSYFTTRSGGELVGFWCTRSTVSSSVGVKSTVRKDITRRLLQTHTKLSVAEGRSFTVQKRDGALTYGASLGFPLVVKPAEGSKGRGITVGIRSESELARAWDVAVATGTKYVIVERAFVGGTEARFLVVGRRCVAVTRRIPPNVEGDGTRTVGQLIAAKNEYRASLPHLRRRLIEMDAHRVDYIGRRGFTLESVLPAGEQLFLDDKANMSAGADAVDLTDDVHPSFNKVAVEAVQAFPALGIAGVDILAHDLARPAQRGNYIVVELNSMPAIGSHHFPGVGESRDAAGAIIDHVLGPEKGAGLVATAAAGAAGETPGRRLTRAVATKLPDTLVERIRPIAQKMRSRGG